jgi:hypothetical protein
MNLMLNMKDINKILAKIESYVWGKNCNIWSSLILLDKFIAKKKHEKYRQPPAVLLNSLKFCAPVVFVWFWLFFSFIYMFCRSLFVFLYFFFWPLCCLFFFDIRILRFQRCNQKLYI